MNQTKKITQGAMLLAIIGAIMIIDRQLAYAFETFIILLTPVIIIVYSMMYDVKSGGIFCFGIAVLNLLFGSPYSYGYLPVIIMVGLGYSWAANRNVDNRTLIYFSMLLFVLGEIAMTFILLPLVGNISVNDQIAELQLMWDEYMNAAGNIGFNISTLGMDTGKILLVVLVIATVITGIVEGLLVHLISVLVLRRFKIKDIPATTLSQMSISPPVAYICFLMMFLLVAGLNYIKIPILSYILLSLSILAACILFFNGYLFCITYSRAVLKANYTLFLLIFLVLGLPFSFMIFILIGFLYGSGPLRKLLERKMNEA